MQAGEPNRLRSVLVAGLLLALSWQSHAQSLGDAAARERERRKEIGKPAPKVTDQDLGGGRPASGSSAASPTLSTVATPKASTAEPVDEPETFTEEEERQDRLEAWRQMLEGTRGEVEQMTAEVDRLQASLNGVSGLYGGARAERIGQLEKAKQDLATSRRALEELEDMGRRRGYR